MRCPKCGSLYTDENGKMVATGSKVLKTYTLENYLLPTSRRLRMCLNPKCMCLFETQERVTHVVDTRSLSQKT